MTNASPERQATPETAPTPQPATPEPMADEAAHTELGSRAYRAAFDAGRRDAINEMRETRQWIGDFVATPVAASEPVPSSEPVAQWGDPRVKIVYDLICDCDGPTDPEEHWEGWVARRIVDALATLPAPQAAPKFSCHLERDQGKAPCAVDCGKLRCMYPSKPAPQAAEPSSEPVAWRYKDSRNHWRYVGHRPDAGYDRLLKPEPLYATLPAPQAAELNWDAITKRLMQLLTVNTVQVFAKDGGLTVTMTAILEEAFRIAAGPATPAVEPTDEEINSIDLRPLVATSGESWLLRYARAVLALAARKQGGRG